MEGQTNFLDAVALCLFALAAHRFFPRFDRILTLAENGAFNRLPSALRKLLGKGD